MPDRRSRPHSHDPTTKLFARAGLRPRIVQVAEEKQTIVNLVAARRHRHRARWASRLAMAGVRFVPLAVKDKDDLKILPLAAWPRGSRDPARDAMLAVLRRRLKAYAAKA